MTELAKAAEPDKLFWEDIFIMVQILRALTSLAILCIVEKPIYKVAG